jgi:pimeloyl-ACP methyl ester carboxylesterase
MFVNWLKLVCGVHQLNRVDLVGHSIAGDEMTRFALMYPHRVRKLVYVEAAYEAL